MPKENPEAQSDIPPQSGEGLGYKRPRLEQLFSGSPDSTPETQAQFEHAESLFGNDFMGPVQVEKAFGFQLTPEQVPSIPFSPERLERARQMGQMLVLHVDKAPDGKLMVMQNMKTMQADSRRNEALLHDADWYQNEDFYTQDAPRLSWRLVSKSVLPDSTNKNKVEQMELIVKTLQNTVFEGMEMPADYQEAINEFEAKKADIVTLMESDKEWPKASEMIEALKLSRLTCGTPAEMIQAIETHYQNTGEYLFTDIYVRTSRRLSDGCLVRVGNTRAGSVYVGRNHPGNRYSTIGVSLSLQS